MWYYLSHLALKKVCEWISENFRRLFCLLTLVQLKEEFTFCCCEAGVEHSLELKVFLRVDELKHKNH